MPLLETFANASRRGWFPGVAAADTGAFDLLSSTILSGTALSVTFDTSTYAALGYKHLQIRLVARSNKSSGGETISYRLNADSGANYTMHLLQGANGSVTTAAYTAQSGEFFIDITGAASTANAFTPAIIDISDAFSSTKNKTLKTFWGDVAQWNAVNLRSSAWLSNAAITSIELSNWAGNSFVSGSRFSIYGLKG